MFNLLHRGYTGLINSKEGPNGVAECHYEFYRNWVLNAEAARESVEHVTRTSVGVAECPIEDLPVEAVAAASTQSPDLSADR